MAEKKDEKVKNEVHENKIWIERVTKEKYNAKLTTVCNPNPRQRYFDGADKVNSKSALEEADPGFAQRTEKAHAAPQIRYSGPITSSQEYGWDHVPLMKRYDDKPDYPFDVSGRTKTITAITRNGFIKR